MNIVGEESFFADSTIFTNGLLIVTALFALFFLPVIAIKEIYVNRK